ncbi:MAG: hypothetical protein DCC67_08675 [Planctomycetota bacterium]|nr:MAG: hypothetical protein DCC67_08675 [Planctomycetota bacterium]
MDETKPAAEAPPETAASQGRASRLIGGVLNWATATRLRLTIASACGLTALGLVFAAWSYVGEVTLETIDPITADQALLALDQGRLSDAKSLVGQMQHHPAPPEALAKALFVLGALKSEEASHEPLPDRRRAMHQVAARYLDKARGLGLPEERTGQLSFLLGSSLARSGRWDEALPLLEEARRDVAQPATEIYSLLVEAIFAQAEPDLNLALSYNSRVLEDPNLPADQRDRALLLAAGVYLRQQKFADARAMLDQMSAEGPLAASRVLLLGRIEIEEAQALPSGSPEQARKLQVASELLGKIHPVESNANDLARQAALWTARCLELRGDESAALAEYERISAAHPDTSEGQAAGLAAADYHRRAGNIEQALAGFRRVLREIGRKEGFENPLMPPSEVRQRLREAYQQCVDEAMFAEALVLVELFEPLFGRVVCAEMRAQLHQRWGDLLLESGAAAAAEHAASERKDGRYHLRAAGQAYEQLGRLRFASAKFSDDLWNAAECYLRGQNYTNAARLLREYLHHESERRNAMAMLRLGQSYLALNKLEEAIAWFGECTELYPNDPVSFQARLECARARQQRGDHAEAERLLLANLVGKGLTPASSEWRDSLFALGDLFYETGRYAEAIEKLDEAIKRYPDARQALVAKYTIARCHHSAAEAPAKRLAESRTDNERQAARALLNEELTKAHEYYQLVQRELTLRDQAGSDPLERVLLRNCYLMQGSVLVELRRFDDAIAAFGSVITSYQNDPVALESFVQVANCWRRLNQPVKARVTLDQAKMVLKGMPESTDFLASTNFNRQQWEMLLNQMSQW